MPVKEITSACHCAIVIPTERSDEGSLFHNYCKYFADPHLFATDPHYEKKKGDLNGVDAVWINRQYRLLFNSSPDEEGIVVNALLFEISKHYE